MWSLKSSNLLTTLSILTAILGGIFFGLFSCGGYVWHKELFNVVFCVLLITNFIFPPALFKKSFLRFLLIIIIVCLFIFVQAIASAFYPSFPETWAEFFSEFINGLIFGPC